MTNSGNRIFVGAQPAGIVYADRQREVDGDYARLAFVSFKTLEVEFARRCPAELRAEILSDAAKLQARRGEKYPVDACGHTVTLGA